MAKEAKYYERLGEDGQVQCHLCPHECKISPGKTGFCKVRRNEGGVLLSLTYGKVVAVAMDPVEKKPLYHFHPGSPVLSLGQAGCTFHCDFCQNYHMLDPDVPQQELSPDEAVRLARNESSFGIAYTYNEPYVGFEYVLDCAIRAREAGLKNIMVTNGYYMPEPFEELAPLVDAMNIDLKSMRDDFYATYVKGSLEPVQRTIETALEKGIHVELTALLITGLNDSEEDVKELVDYVSGLGLDIPLHISRYHPAYKMHRPPTPADVLRRAYEIASSRLHYVYLGNVVGMEGTDTHCPNCGETLVSRSGFSSRVISLDGKRCSACGYETNFVV